MQICIILEQLVKLPTHEGRGFPASWYKKEERDVLNDLLHKNGYHLENSSIFQVNPNIEIDWTQFSYSGDDR